LLFSVLAFFIKIYLKEFAAYEHISFAAALLAASLSLGFAGNYYGAISYVDTELQNLNSNGVSLTVGRNVDYGFLTAIQLTYDL
jgi:hypothetical protein